MVSQEERLPTARADAVLENGQPQEHYQGHQPTASNASLSSASSSCSSVSNADESEESYLDSLEEGRAPLLRGTDNVEEDDGGSTDSRLHNRNQNRATAMYSNENCNNPKPHTHRFPKERYKTGIAFLLLFIAGCMNDLVLSYIHDFVPDTPPLPDFVFSHTAYLPWALRISEYLMLSSFAALMLLAISHKHRWIVFRRIAVIGALLYFGRCVTMFVTQVPKADPNYHCSPKMSPDNRTVGEVVLRAFRILSGLGLAINGKHTLCGDYIYSGHTVVLVTCYLFIKEYSPRRWRILHVLSALASTVGVFCLLISRGHYTVDVVIAYWISTRVFWQYHTLTGFAVLREGRQEHNHLTKVCWYPLFKYMESNVLRPLPHRYGFPLMSSLDRFRRIRLLKTNDH